jgi:hypothetical protein
MNRFQITLAILASLFAGVLIGGSQQMGAMGDGIGKRIADDQREKLFSMLGITREDLARGGRVYKSRIAAEEEFAKQMGHAPAKMESPLPEMPDPEVYREEMERASEPAKPTQVENRKARVIMFTDATCPPCRIWKSMFGTLEKNGWKIGESEDCDIQICDVHHEKTWATRFAEAQKEEDGGQTYMVPQFVLIADGEVLDRAKTVLVDGAYAIKPRGDVKVGKGVVGIAEWINHYRTRSVLK